MSQLLSRCAFRLVLLLALALAACGSPAGAPDAGMDLALVDRAIGDLPGAPDMPPPDQSMPHDLTVVDFAVVDLATSHDLPSPPDLVKTADLAKPGDAAAITPCGANAGYGSAGHPDGGFSPCGQQGMCNGNTYQLDCDGFSCTCTYNKMVIQTFVQMMATCQNLNGPWTTVCGF